MAQVICVTSLGVMRNIEKAQDAELVKVAKKENEQTWAEENETCVVYAIVPMCSSYWYGGSTSLRLLGMELSVLFLQFLLHLNCGDWRSLCVLRLLSLKVKLEDKFLLKGEELFRDGYCDDPWRQDYWWRVRPSWLTRYDSDFGFSGLAGVPDLGSDPTVGTFFGGGFCMGLSGVSYGGGNAIVEAAKGAQRFGLGLPWEWLSTTEMEHQVWVCKAALEALLGFGEWIGLWPPRRLQRLWTDYVKDSAGSFCC
ncbi:hypothetical protein ACLB2K_058515 [Fragaria x ananassa]